MKSGSLGKTMDPKLKYITKNFDSLSILTVLTNVMLNNLSEPSLDDQMVINAFRRFKKDFDDASFEEMGEYLSNMNERQIEGVINNVKGILHEMEFVQMENEDGDSIMASLFQDTNHPGFDVMMVDEKTNETWEIQLKTTENTSEVTDWIDAHPDGEIQVNEELAEKLNLPSTGLSDKELEVRVEDVVDKLKNVTEDDSVWNYFPALTAVSISIIIWELYKKYQSGEISLERFKWMAAKITGLKLAKISFLMFLLTIPVLNVITGYVLVYGLIKSAQGYLDK